jgi:hypothetical protein
MGVKEIPSTGKSVTGTGTYFASVREGKIVSFRAHPDVASMMGQLGLMPGMRVGNSGSEHEGSGMAALIRAGGPASGSVKGR